MYKYFPVHVSGKRRSRNRSRSQREKAQSSELFHLLQMFVSFPLSTGMCSVAQPFTMVLTNVVYMEMWTPLSSLWTPLACTVLAPFLKNVLPWLIEYNCVSPPPPTPHPDAIIWVYFRGIVPIPPAWLAYHIQGHIHTASPLPEIPRMRWLVH